MKPKNRRIVSALLVSAMWVGLWGCGSSSVCSPSCAMGYKVGPNCTCVLDGDGGVDGPSGE